MKLIKTTLASAILLASASALAGTSSATLEVTGTIKPSSCQLDLGDGTFDYGQVSSGILRQSTVTALTQKTIDAAVTCDAPSRVSLAFVDNRGASSDSDKVGSFDYGLGTTAHGNKIGYTMFYVRTPTIDGQPGKVMRGAADGSAWEAPDSGYYTAKKGYVMAFAAGSDTTPSIATTVQFKLGNSTNLNGRDALGEDVAGDIALDGNATLQLNYL